MDNYTKIVDLANWYEIVAYLYLHSELNKKIIDNMKIKETIAMFGKKLSKEAFVYVPNEKYEFDWKEIWTNIYELMKNID